LYASDSTSPELVPKHNTASPDVVAKDGTPLPLDDASTPTEERVIINDDVEDLDPRDSKFWLDMTATLEECFGSSKDSNDDDNHITISDHTTDFLASAPRILHTFSLHGEACTKTEAEVLRLVSNAPVPQDEDEPLKVYTDILDDLERLLKRASLLEQSISRLAGIVNGKLDTDGDVSGKNADELASPNLAARLELQRVFAACLPVLRARKANLTMAQDLIDSAQENLSISLKMEYLGIE